MSKRKGYTDNQNLVLFNEVNGICPLCTTVLMYDKSGKKYKGYELAHIYPLNPDAGESALLVNEERLSDDVNDIANIIALCKPCHTKFDKPRTVEEYRELIELKRKSTKQTKESALWYDYKIEAQISEIIDSIKFEDDLQQTADLGMTAMKLSEKFDSSISALTKRKIRSHVDEYFSFIRDKFRRIEESNPGAADLIAQQVKTYYTKQKSLGHSQQDIYKNIVAWLQAHTNEDEVEAVDIVASFFVQNCEVF